MNLYDVIKRPLVTEKGVTKKDAERTLCFEVAAGANKTQIRQAVQTIFKVKVEDVRTSVTAGKLRRRGRFAGYRADWKKAYVRLKVGEKIPEYAETAGKFRQGITGNSGKQAGDPVRAGEAIIKALESTKPPLRLLLGKSALERARIKMEQLQNDVDTWQETTLSADYPEGQSAGAD